MTYYKTAAPCEVCGERVKHSGSDKGFVVGYTTKSVPRLVHERCRRQWIDAGSGIMAKWVELRPDVLQTLPRTLQFRIQRLRDTFIGGTMSRKPSHEVFQPSPQLCDWLKEKLKEERPRKKGAIKRWLGYLLQRHADWVTHQDQAVSYTVFYNVVIDVERKMEWLEGQDKKIPAPPSTPVGATDSPGTVPAEPPQTDRLPESNDLPTMAQVAHSLIDLALQRQDRDGIQFTLEGLAHLLQTPKKPS